MADSAEPSPSMPQLRPCSRRAPSPRPRRPPSSPAARCFPDLFPTNQRVDRLPVAPDSAAIVALDRPGRPASTPTSAPAARRAGRSGSRTTWSTAAHRARACASATPTSPTASATRSRAAVHIEGGRDADGDRHALLRRPQRLPALRAVRLQGRPGAWTRGLGRDVEPALDARSARPAGRRADAAGPADPAAARPLRRGRSAAGSTTRCA